MDYKLASGSKSKKTYIAIIAALAIVGVVATVSFSLKSPQTPALIQLQIDEQEFQDFIAKYNKNYSEEEYARRFKIFRDNSAYIRVFNTQGKTWFLGVNEFTDMTFAEFKMVYTPSKILSDPTIEASVLQNTTIPTQVDWSAKGAVTPVKNQGQCGGCWAFATTGSCESAWFLAGHNLTSLSEQQLMDCSYSYGNLACGGGTMTQAMKYVVKNGGITSEDNYPYTAHDGLCNQAKEKQFAATFTSYKVVKADDVQQMQIAVAQQPIRVSVEADQNAWQLYKGGIVSSDCGTNLDHEVLVVGYNQLNSPQYWKVKNSWGTTWGEAGYIRIAIVAGRGVCGIQMQPAYPIV
ncbi:unnamed protein product [Blepharisma stoltei]|uniref:Papain family cysteine protease n=1 Tax=Blepharisma stoltei TaxID=1481888 RepID=A0AAU9K3E7_9CILI|nr:unnamed protein product [Blepharisma stoltei]